jgi:hypothetical protein
MDKKQSHSRFLSLVGTQNAEAVEGKTTIVNTRYQILEMKKTNFFIAIIALFISGCNNPTKEELRIISILNEKYHDYEFSPGSDYLGTHLNMHLTKHKWDSLSLKIMYDSTVNLYSDSTKVSWVYLAVYDKTNKYLFTIVKDNGKNEYVFFEE